MTIVDSDPNDEPPLAGALVPKLLLQLPGFVVLNLNQPVVVELFGLAVPFNVAALVVILVAVFVVTVGGSGVV